jgi:hypothetical protein
MLADAGGSTISLYYITKLTPMEVLFTEDERHRISDILDTIDEANRTYLRPSSPSSSR